ncbi:MAG: hypothetical protein IJR61_05365 [Clostridia bacterium]|nr:hypothetical protein [Clostridia bacterium]
MKKILIFTVTAGNGHNSCAKAVKELAEKDGAEVVVKDIFREYSNKFYTWIFDGGYNVSVGKLRRIYNASYNRLYNKTLKPDCVAQLPALSVAAGMLKEIYTYRPDVIFCTHFFAALVITDLRRVYDIPAKVVLTALDYLVSPYMELCTGVDRITIPHEDFTEGFRRKGFTEGQIAVTGLPVNDKFNHAPTAAEARKKLGIGREFVITVIFGGGHWNGALTMVKEVIRTGREIHLIVINGHNKKSYNKIEDMEIPENVKLTNVGFTDEVEVYLQASDIVLSKAGGPSLTEIINLCKPVLITEKLPSQEILNMEYLKAKGMAESFGNKRQLLRLIEILRKDGGKHSGMAENMRAFRRNGIKNVAELLLSLPQANYSEEYISSIDYKTVKKRVKAAYKKAGN